VKFFKYVSIILIIAASQSATSAKIYKCKDSSGKMVFSNMRCKGGQPEAGLIAEDKEMSQRTKITQGYVTPTTGLSNAEVALRQLRVEQDRERLINRQEKMDRQAEILNDAMINNAQQRSTPKVSKTDCKYNKARSKYWKKEARERGHSKKDKHKYKSYQYMYEGKADGC